MRKTTTHKLILQIITITLFVLFSSFVYAENIENKDIDWQDLINLINDNWGSGQIINWKKQNKKNLFGSWKVNINNQDIKWALQKFKEMPQTEKDKIINKAKEVIQNTSKENIQKIKNKVEEKKKEVTKNIQEEIKKQKEAQINEAKKQFEAKKQEIINQAKSWKILPEEAKKMIIKHKDELINKTKENLNNSAQKIKQENKINLKAVVKKQLESKLSWIEKLTKAEQKNKFAKLDASIDKLIKTATSTQKEIYLIMRELIREKINLLK